MLLVTLGEVTGFDPTLLYQSLDDKVNTTQTDLKISGDLALISAWLVRQVRQDIEFFFVRHVFQAGYRKEMSALDRSFIKFRVMFSLAFVHEVNMNIFLYLNSAKSDIKSVFD